MLIIDVYAPRGWWWFFSAESFVVCHAFRAQAVKVLSCQCWIGRCKPLGHSKMLCGTLHLAILTSACEPGSALKRNH